MIENILKEKIQSRFYNEIVSETQQAVSELLAELDSKLLAQNQEEKILTIELARKQTQQNLKNEKGKHPFKTPVEFSLVRKSVIDSFSHKRVDSYQLYSWMSKIKKLDKTLNALKYDVSRLQKDATSLIDQSDFEISSSRIKEISTFSERDFIKEFESDDFYRTLAIRFPTEEEAIQALCEEIDSTTTMLIQTLSAKEGAEFSTIRLRQCASSLGSLASDIEKVNKDIFDGMIDDFYKRAFESDIKYSLVRPLSLYEHDKALKAKIDAISGTNFSERDQYVRDPKVRNLAIMTLNKEATRIALVDCHQSFEGLFIDHCEAEVFVSLFLSNQFIQPVNWIGLNKELHHFIKGIKDMVVSETPWELANNCFLKDGQPFGNDSIRTAYKGNPISENSQMIIDEAIHRVNTSRKVNI